MSETSTPSLEALREARQAFVQSWREECMSIARTILDRTSSKHSEELEAFVRAPPIVALKPPHD